MSRKPRPGLHSVCCGQVLRILAALALVGLLAAPPVSARMSFGGCATDCCMVKEVVGWDACDAEPCAHGAWSRCAMPYLSFALLTMRWFHFGPVHDLLLDAFHSAPETSTSVRVTGV